MVPFITKIVQESPDKAKRAFEFFEEMETSGDLKIGKTLFEFANDGWEDIESGIRLYLCKSGREDDCRMRLQSIQ